MTLLGKEGAATGIGWTRKVTNRNRHPLGYSASNTKAQSVGGRGGKTAALAQKDNPPDTARGEGGKKQCIARARSKCKFFTGQRRPEVLKCRTRKFVTIMVLKTTSYNYKSETRLGCEIRRVNVPDVTGWHSRAKSARRCVLERTTTPGILLVYRSPGSVEVTNAA